MAGANAPQRGGTVEVGQELPVMRKEISQTRMMAYGAATWDFIRVHYDADYIRGRGFEAPFVDGQMLGAYLAQLVQDWAGPGCFLKKLSFRNRRMVFAGDVVTCGGTVKAVAEEEGATVAEVDLWIENQRGERILEPAGGVVRLPGEGG